VTYQGDEILVGDRALPVLGESEKTSQSIIIISLGWATDHADEFRTWSRSPRPDSDHSAAKHLARWLLVASLCRTWERYVALRSTIPVPFYPPRSSPRRKLKALWQRAAIGRSSRSI